MKESFSTHMNQAKLTPTESLHISDSPIANKEEIINYFKYVVNEIAIQMEHGGRGVIDSETENNVITALEHLNLVDISVEDLNNILQSNRLINKSFNGPPDQEKALRRGKAIEQLRKKITLLSHETKPAPQQERILTDDARDFMQFAQKNEAHMLTLKKSDLSNFIYKHFCIKSKILNTKNTTMNEAAQTVKDNCMHSVKKLYLTYHTEVKNLGAGVKSDIQLLTNSYWFGLDINEGIKHITSRTGRIYLNIKPEKLSEIFEKFISKARVNKLKLQAKIPIITPYDDADITIEKLTRTDKMVIYFPENQDGGIIQILESIYHEHQEYFIDDTPRFTKKIKDSQSQTMSGISFGENPHNKHNSFNEARSLMLAGIWMDAKEQGFSVTHPHFDFKKSLQTWSHRYNINPLNLAFNLPTNSQTFPVLQKHLN